MHFSIFHRAHQQLFPKIHGVVFSEGRVPLIEVSDVLLVSVRVEERNEQLGSAIVKRESHADVDFQLIFFIDLKGITTKEEEKGKGKGTLMRNESGLLLK